MKLKLSLLLAPLIIITMAVTTGCTDDTVKDEGKIGVAVSILPQAEFLERIGGDKVSVTVMVPPGEDPHMYSPSISQMTQLSEARVYASVGSGIDFELAWLDRFIAANPTMLVIDCSKDITLAESTFEEELEEHDHHHEIDPHIWTSPRKVMVMVQNITAGLIEVDPGNRSFYETNRDDYLAELQELDSYIQQGLVNITKRIFMVYHPAFGYFAADYGLEQLPIEADGKEPTPRGLQALIDQAREHDIKAIFVSPQFNPQSAEVIAGEIGAAVIAIDPLARDYLDNIRHMAEQLITAME